MSAARARRSHRAGAALILGLALLASCASARAAEQVVEIATRPGQYVRALQLDPEKPIGSVILFTGLHGNLALTREGRIGWGRMCEPAACWLRLASVTFGYGDCDGS